MNKALFFTIACLCLTSNNVTCSEQNRPSLIKSNRVNQNIALATITGAGAFYASNKAIFCLQNKFKKYPIAQGNAVGNCAKIALTASIVCSTLLVKTCVDFLSDCQELGDAICEIFKDVKDIQKK